MRWCDDAYYYVCFLAHCVIQLGSIHLKTGVALPQWLSSRHSLSSCWMLFLWYDPVIHLWKDFTNFWSFGLIPLLGFLIRNSMQTFKCIICHRCWAACCNHCIVTWHPLAYRSSRRPWEHVLKCSVRSRCLWLLWTWRQNHRHKIWSKHR